MIEQELLDNILNEVFKLDQPAIDKSRRPLISEFLTSAINGDQCSAFLVINATLAKDRLGALIYILTNARLIKIDIDEKNISSSSPSLNTIINIDRKIENGNNAKIAISFQNEFYGLSYSANNQKITDFFQQVDKARTTKGNM